MYPIPVKSEVIDEFQRRYDLVGIINLVFFDLDLDKLTHEFQQWSKVKFEPQQRLLVLHHDTDYYVENQGNTTYNVIKLLGEYRIPTEHVIILTNHYGLEQEVQHQCNQVNVSLPKVIYTSLWYDYPDPEHITNIPNQESQYLFCCLNGVERSHRLATLCYLEHYNLIDQGQVSYHFG